MNIGYNIKKIRKDKGILQKTLAEMLGNMPISTLANYENNHREPNIEMLNKIANALGVTVSDLIENETISIQPLINKLILIEGLPLKEIATKSEIAIDELNDLINGNKKLSLELFKKICKYKDLTPEEESFLYSNYFYETNNESFRVVVFYNYLHDDGIELCNPNDDYTAASQNLSEKLNFNIVLKETDKRLVTKIINHTDEYKKTINSIYDEHLYHKGFNVNTLTDEEYYNLYTKMVESLDFEIFKLIKRNKEGGNNA